MIRRTVRILALAAAAVCVIHAQSIITTIAGMYPSSFQSTGDGGAGTSAQIGFPNGVAVDANGNVYIMDALNRRVRKVNSSGTISTYVGNGFPGFSGDGGPATSASINPVGTSTHTGIAVDKLGNLYIADTGNNRIRKVDTSGTITTIAGIGGTTALSGDGGAATSANLGTPYGVGVDGNGNVYIADTGNGRVRKVDTSGIITTVAGSTPGFTLGDGGPATSAQLANPDDVVVDSAGNIYIADYGNSRIRKVDTTGKISSVSLVTVSVAGLALDVSNNLYYAAASCVYKVTTGVPACYAGGGINIPGDNGPPTSAGLGTPTGVVLDAAGNLYLSDRTEGLVRKVTPGATCNYTLSTTSLTPPAAGGSFPITITTTSTCAWSVTGLPTWITVTGASSGTGNGSVTVVAAATSAARTATFAIGGVAVSVTQAAPAACTYAISSTGQVFPAAGGTAVVAVTAPAGCAWDVLGLPDGVSPSVLSGSGNGNVTVNVQPNSGPARSGVLVIAGLIWAVQQQAGSITGLTLLGSMPHLPGEAGWSTILTFVNKGNSGATARASLFAANGTAMTLPVGLPQMTSLAGPLLAASLDQPINANASWVLQAGGTTSTTLEGSAQLQANGSGVDGFAIFHYDPNNQEAVVPLETRSAASYLLAFDNTNSVLTGVALANQNGLQANIPVVIRDDGGNQIATDTIQIAGNGHTSFVLGGTQPGQMYPQTANLRGTIEFDTPTGGRISAVGIRYTPPGTTTTIPALANVATSTIPALMSHLASGNGWQTTFVLVNVGPGTATATLNFYGDNGLPLILPLTFPQGGSSAPTSSYPSPVLVSGASWYVQSGGDLSTALLSGSAQMTTTGNIGAFVIFRYNPNGQEAVVPLENRGASTYYIAFDNTTPTGNTAPTATGIAVANGSSTGINLPYTVRDDTGAVISGGTGTISLPANGHTSFGLAQFTTGSAGRRGVIVFAAPTGATIGVLGIRSPPALTFTTLPALAK